MRIKINLMVPQGLEWGSKEEGIHNVEGINMRIEKVGQAAAMREYPQNRGVNL